MYGRLLCLISCVGLISAEKDICELSPAGLEKIHNITSSYEFHLLGHNNSTGELLYEATRTFKWDIEEGADYDGILYKFSDKAASIFPSIGLADGGIDACSRLSNNIWAVDDSGDPVNCSIPCQEHMPPICYFSSVCRAIEDGYVSLARDARRVSVPFKLGRKYKLQIRLYRAWSAGQSESVHLDSVLCENELATTLGINLEVAQQRCTEGRNKLDNLPSTGPPLNLQKCVPEKDLENGNKAKCYFSWKKPQYIAPNAELTSFAIHVTEGDPYPSSIQVEDVTSDADGLWFGVWIRNIRYETQSTLKITPVVRWSNNCGTCSTFGAFLTETFIVPDANACAQDNDSGGYCDINADCVDLPATSDAPANCTCREGFRGNGINSTWETGTGCVDNEIAVDLTDQKEVCELSPAGLEKIHNITSSYEFHLLGHINSTGELWYEATRTFRWDIDEGADYDGILYKFSDKAVTILPPVANGDGGLDACSSLSNNIWAVNDVGNPINCSIPCQGHMPPTCYFSSVCQSIDNDYVSLPKGARSISVPFELGRKYKFQMRLYRAWSAGRTESLHLDPVLCKNELITIHGIDDDVAHLRCTEGRNNSDSTPSTGPPSELQECVPEKDLENGNRAKCYFSWRQPHDIAPNAELTSFLIHVTEGKPDPSLIVVEDGTPDADGVVWFGVWVRNIPYETQSTLKITPVVKWSPDCNSCSKFGEFLTETFLIPDADACVHYNESAGYCDINADCADLPVASDAPANCTCREGFVGNGINRTWESGTGCTDYNACVEEDLCDPNAVCIDSPAPYFNSTCFCPNGFIGDGYTSGSGCTQRSLVVALAVGIPLATLMATVVFFIVWKARAVKRRKIEKAMSKFFSTQDVVYSASKHVVRNGHAVDNQASAGVFGDRWELDRNSIELKGILGRGNFGVVQTGVMTVEGQEKTVAVKMTTANSSDALRDAFLAEISMICSMGQHENLIGMIGCCTTGTNPIYLVSEFMKYGDLLHFLWNAREEPKRASDAIYNLTELDIYRVGCQVASGMKYLKDIKIIHGDLAARNILVGEGLTCKISDFGLANDVYRYGMIKDAIEKTVPLKWVSPERMQGGKIPVTWRSDVWSFGILLYESVTLGAAPYPDTPRDQIFERLNSGYRMQRPTSCSQYLYEIMLKCWEWSPSKRPSFKEIEKYMQAPLSRINEHYVNLSAMVDTMDDHSNRGEGNSPLQSDPGSSSHQPDFQFADGTNGSPLTSTDGCESRLHIENEIGETTA